MISPYSTLQEYTIKEQIIANRHISFNIRNLKEFDYKAAIFVRENGAAASFHIAETSKEAKKLKKLCRARVMCMYCLAGKIQMNVVSWMPMELTDLLKTCARVHFTMLTGYQWNSDSVYIDNVEYQLYIPRANEPMDILTANAYPSIVIISDIPRPEFKDLTNNAKIFLDEDICENITKEYKPADFA